MSSIFNSCPFNFDLTSLKSNDYSVEISPLKDLSQVIAFYNDMSKGKRIPWLISVSEIQPATDFCYFNTENEFNEEGWFPKPRIDRSSVPKTLLCHDYKGGYLEDRFIDGSHKHESYNFFNWTCVDIFVYFSHNFVTIPPPVWINAAHTHGVSILGTLITEGKNSHLIWEEILESEAKAQWFAEAIALIAKTFRFDGYLLNIETPISVNLMPKLMMFIKSLKQFLRKYKEFKTYVIWYDSITVYGELKWQNELNYNNKPFFDITDGIFLNYSWTEQNLNHSKKMAGERIHDVFVGVDVFGRNMFGGGGYNTRLAMQVVYQKNLSSAIFAFGWTEEKIPGKFSINDEIFWMSIAQYLYSHGIKKFPFHSDFNRGCGLKYYNQGIVVSDTPWYNLSKQSYQYHYLKCKTKANRPLFDRITSVVKEYVLLSSESKSSEEPSLNLAKADRLLALTLDLNNVYKNIKNSIIEYTFDDAYYGGGCIRINPSLEEGIRHVPLFDTDIQLKNEWFVKTVMKSEKEKHLSDVEMYPIVYLVIQNEDGVLIKLELRHGEVEFFQAEWVSRRFILTQKGRILEIGLLINPTHRPVLLGQILINDWLFFAKPVGIDKEKQCRFQMSSGDKAEFSLKSDNKIKALQNFYYTF